MMGFRDWPILSFTNWLGLVVSHTPTSPKVKLSNLFIIAYALLQDIKLTKGLTNQSRYVITIGTHELI